MFGIGMSEMLIILVVALLVFGPQKLPEVAKMVAKGLRELRKASDDLRSTVMVNLDDEVNTAHRSPASLGASTAASAVGVDPPIAGASSGAATAVTGEVPGAAAPDALPVETAADPRHAAASEPEKEVWPKPAEGAVARGALDERPSTEAEGVPAEGVPSRG
jgi:TatA/E family protein of Tat protein translocase